MTKTLATGAHRITFVQPDLLLLVLGGDVSPSEARHLAEFHQQHTSNLSELRYIVDVKQLGELGPESRRVLLSGCSKTRSGPSPFRVQLGVVGARMRAKVLLTLQIVAMAESCSVDLQPRYFFTRDEALRWAGLDSTEEAAPCSWAVARGG